MLQAFLASWQAFQILFASSYLHYESAESLQVVFPATFRKEPPTVLPKPATGIFLHQFGFVRL